MNTRKWVSIVAGALVAGVVLGNIVSASAATTGSTTSAGTGNPIAACANGLGMRLGPMMQSAGARVSDIVAKLTGLSVADVQAQRQAGKSFEQIAGAKGVSAATVVDETLAARKAALDKAVSSGQITQAQEDAALANMKTRLTQRVSDPSAGCAGAGGGRGQGRGAGRGMGGCGGGCAATN